MGEFTKDTEPALQYVSQSDSKYNDIIFKMFASSYHDVDVEKIKKETNVKQIMVSKILKSYQKFIGNYLLKTSYRGVVVYHGLGSGKTLTSLYAMNKLNMNTIILLPAALKQSWFAEQLEHKNKGHKSTFETKYLSYNASNLKKQYYNLNYVSDVSKEINNFDNKLIIIDESHEFFQNVISGKATQAFFIYKKMKESKKSRFIFLTGTPLSGDPFELVPCFNLLRGFDLFPKMRPQFNRLFISSDSKNIINGDVFQERITGLVSYYRGPKDVDREIVPEKFPLKIVKIEMGNYQNTSYGMIKQKEEDIERLFKYQKTAFKVGEYKRPERSSVGTYKVNSSKACNFVFPEKVEKIYTIMKLLKMLPKIGGKITPEYWKNINKKYNFNTKHMSQPIVHRVAEFKWFIMVNKYTFKELQSMLPNLSTKIVKLLTMIKKFQKLGEKVFVFSKWDILGTRIIGKMLESYNFERIVSPQIQMQTQTSAKKPSSPKFIIVDGQTKNKSELIDYYNREENANGEKCNTILGTTVLSRGISLSCVRHIIIFEPQWRYITLNQVIGRGSRLFSHKFLPKEKRTLQPYILLSETSNPSKIESTDVFLYNHSLKLENLNNQFLDLIKNNAIDCRFLFSINNMNGKLKCHTCSSTNTNTITLFPKNYLTHISQGPICKKIVKKKLKLSPIPNMSSKYKKNDKNEIFKKSGSFWKKVGSMRNGDEIEFY
jgi:superfamily II DNA or RNA helicase